MNALSPGLWDRTLQRLTSAWQEIAEALPLAGAGDLDRLRQEVRACIEARGGETLARAHAARIGHAYLAQDHAGRRRFLTMLASDFDIDTGAVENRARALIAASDAAAKRKLAAALRETAEAPRMRLFTRFNALPDGLEFLVDMRAEALAGRHDRPALGPLAEDLRRLLSAWFDVGFLELRRLTWDMPASLLEKLIAYEAVHRIASWDDLKHRLESDRRLFAFFHPHMPDEPLIFVAVALVEALADNVQRLLDRETPALAAERAEVAIFYSISNTQPGLAGVSLGDFLIKRVVARLQRELPQLRTFATLSPMPGFTGWLRRHLAAAPMLERPPAGIAPARAPAALIAALDAASAAALKPWQRPLTILAGRYLLEEKRGGRPLDAVARFHLANGARVERLNWMGDLSPRGLAEAAGLMVNYLYRLDEIAANHEAFVTQGRIAASGELRALARR